MQKWEYMYISRTRGWERDGKAYIFTSTDWNYYIWQRGAKERREWKGENFADLLCELGDQGWELVSSHPRSDYLGGSWQNTQSAGGGTAVANDIAGFTTCELFIFKRPKP